MPPAVQAVVRSDLGQMERAWRRMRSPEDCPRERVTPMRAAAEFFCWRSESMVLRSQPMVPEGLRSAGRFSTVAAHLKCHACLDADLQACPALQVPGKPIWNDVCEALTGANAVSSLAKRISCSSTTRYPCLPSGSVAAIGRSLLRAQLPLVGGLCHPHHRNGYRLRILDWSANRPLLPGVPAPISESSCSAG